MAPAHPPRADRQGSAREGLFKFTVIPQALAFVYYQVSWLLYVMRPRGATGSTPISKTTPEHEHAHLVDEHPEWEDQPFERAFAADYARLDTLADLFRQIGYDERVHKQESLAAMDRPRFA